MDLGNATGEPDPRLISNRVRAIQRGPPYEYAAASIRLDRHCHRSGHLDCGRLVRNVPHGTDAAISPLALVDA